MFLPLEIICQIIEYLPLTFLIFNKKLVQNFVNWQSLINRKFKKSLSEKLRKIGIDGNEFCQALQKYNCVMSGSFLLNCILNEDIELNIDIYSRYKDRIIYGNPIDIWLHNQFKGKFVRHSIGNIFRVPIYCTECKQLTYDKTNKLPYDIQSNKRLSFTSEHHNLLIIYSESENKHYKPHKSHGLYDIEYYDLWNEPKHVSIWSFNVLDFISILTWDKYIFDGRNLQIAEKK